MPVKRANTFTDEDIAKVLDHIERRSRQPERDAALVLLTCRAGLRVGEASSIHARDFMRSDGTVKADLEVSSRGAKNGKSRTVPLRDDLAEALIRYIDCQLKRGLYPFGNKQLFYSAWGNPLKSSTASKHLHTLYRSAGLHWCSSHSGRRTFGTRAARALSKRGGTILDVRDLLGHRDVKSTLDYIDPCDFVRDVVLGL